MPRESYSSSLGTLFGGEVKGGIIYHLYENDAGYRESDLADILKTDRRTVGRTLERLHKAMPDVFEVHVPYSGVKIYRMKRDSWLHEAMKHLPSNYKPKGERLRIPARVGPPTSQEEMKAVPLLEIRQSIHRGLNMKLFTKKDVDQILGELSKQLSEKKKD